jgi:hypothetical protein
MATLAVLVSIGIGALIVAGLFLVVVGWFFSMMRQDQNSKSGLFDLEDGDF